MLVVPRDGDATLVIPRLEAPRVVEQPGVFELRPWGETEDPIGDRRRAGRPARRTVAVGDQMWARFLVELLPQLPGAEFRRAVDVVGPLRMVEGRRRDRRAARRRRRRRPGRRRSCRPARSRSSGAPRPRCRADISAPARRRGPRQGQLRHRRRRRERRQPAPPRRRSGDRARARSCCATSAARWTATAATSPAASSPATPPAEVAEAYAVLHEAQAGRAWRRRRSARRARTSTAPLARIIADAGYGELLHPPHRPRHRHGGARGPLHRRGQRRCRSQPGHAFSIEPGHLRRRAGGGCGSKTSSSPRPTARWPLNRADHDSSASTPDVSASTAPGRTSRLRRRSRLSTT